jgi:hypothetical protein
MPLAFQSLSHGTVAFGFFNIESDMLLLERYFFFAGDFCGWIEQLAVEPGLQEAEWPVVEIAAREQIGDLMGAIHGVRFTGFIGAVYRRFPFPRDPRDFKQSPEGGRTRDFMEDLIAGYGQPYSIAASIAPDAGVVRIGVYRFERRVFHELLDYVWRGGYPRWKDERRPEAVRRMAAAVRASAAPVFSGFSFSK